MVSNKEEVLKLAYDYNKTVLFSVITILVISSLTIPLHQGAMYEVISYLILILSFVSIIFGIKWHKSCSKLRDYYN